MTQLEWKKTFGDNLNAILQDFGMNQSEFARETGLSSSRISDYINGRAAPTVFALINMAYVLDVDMNDFIDFGDRITL